MSKSRATAIGFLAVLLWSLLALFTVGSAPTPPLLLNAVCFTIGGTLGIVWTWQSGGLGQLRSISWKVYAFGTLGLFGYHALYFSALRMAPAAEAGLIAYLWPLLIVLLSGLLPGENLRLGHLIGACLGFSGAALIITGRRQRRVSGRAFARLCAGAAVRADLVRLFRAVQADRKDANKLGGRFLCSDGRRLVGAAFHIRRNALAGNDAWLGVDPGAWAGPGRACLLCLGYRGQTGRYSDAGNQLLRGPFAIDPGFGGGRDCHAQLDIGNRSPADHRRRAACSARQPQTLE